MTTNIINWSTNQSKHIHTATQRGNLA